MARLLADLTGNDLAAHWVQYLVEEKVELTVIQSALHLVEQKVNILVAVKVVD